MSSDAVDDAKTVVSEACANAIRHTCRDGPGGPLEVSVSASDGQLRIVVRDFGSGFGPRPERDGIGLGAGLSIIGALTTGFRLESRRGDGTEIEARLPLPPRPPAVSSSEEGLGEVDCGRQHEVDYREVPATPSAS